MTRKTKQNKITSPELLAQINPENVRLKKDFLSYLRSKQRSPTTIKGYSSDIDIFFVWNLLNNNNKPFVNVSKRDIVAYQEYLISDNENSPARVRRLKASLSSLSNYIEDILDDEYEGYKAIIHKVENPINQPTREKTVLSDDQVEYLLKYLNDKCKFDKACMAALAICSGRRKSELVRFKVDYFKDENLICDGALYKTNERIKTKGRGVNGKQIYCYTLAKKFKPYFDSWMLKRKDLGIDSPWLFLDKNNPNEHMSANTLNSWAISFGKILGVDFYMHSLRHFWTTGLIRAGLPTQVIKELAQWSNLDMVEVYNDLGAEEQFAKWFSGGEINTSAGAAVSDL